MTISRIIFALLAGAVAGGLLIVLFDLFVQLVLQGRSYDWQYGPRHSFALFFTASIIWLAGLLMVGVPYWLVMHKLNYRSWLHVVLTAPVLLFFSTLALETHGFQLFSSHMGGYSAWSYGGATWIDGHMTLHGWIVAAGKSLLLALFGIVIALIVWWVAYREGASNRVRS